MVKQLRTSTQTTKTPKTKPIKPKGAKAEWGCGQQLARFYTLAADQLLMWYISGVLHTHRCPGGPAGLRPNPQAPARLRA